ncbi:hypothetical protein [Paraburkholderia sp. J69-2]|uniref:hypothetical protein n=1 Tax=Paraburkholderia sp. J69-2 TaxID=2805437 RepID=UPI002AB0FA7C|nr:hypothetical protein [Paraburkholderia sp. J69-2]
MSRIFYSRHIRPAFQFQRHFTVDHVEKHRFCVRGDLPPSHVKKRYQEQNSASKFV